METYKMIKAGEETIITEEEAIEIMGIETFEIIKNDGGISFAADDIEIFFITR